MTAKITHENYEAKMRELVEIEGKIMDLHPRGESMNTEQLTYYVELRAAIVAYRRDHVKRIF